MGTWAAPSHTPALKPEQSPHTEKHKHQDVVLYPLVASYKAKVVGQGVLGTQMAEATVRAQG